MSSLHMTAGFCRAQEAIHLAKAAAEPLENRRNIALAAAKAWAAEAKVQDEREAGKAPLDVLDTEIALEFAQEAELPAGDQDELS